VNSLLSANAELIITVVKIVLLLFIVLTVNAYLTWFERKVVAHMQSRWGPHRVGPHGLLQPLADGVKFLFKEDPTPAGADKFVYYLAPLLALALALTGLALIPFGPDPIRLFGHDIYLGIAPPDVNIGILALFAITAMGVYGVALAGWSSNSKYPLLGGLRSSAQMISYELPLALAVAAPLLLANTLSFREMVNYQSGYWLGFIPRWNVIPEILGFVIFVIAGFAETNRVPFDLPEAENELVAGFHTEYSSMKFAAFFMAEYANMVTVTAVATLLFLGGWQPPFPEPYSDFLPIAIFALGGLIAVYHGLHPARRKDKYTLPAAGVLFLGIAAIFGLSLFVPVLKTILMALFWFCGKIGILLFLFIWVRGTLPRFRYDQLMRFAWIFLFPLAMINLLITGLVVALTSK
jgi:NADH-quinone oxidoreductase subunit H